MQTETALGAALAAKGITPRTVALQKALALFRNNGGSFEEAYAELNKAYADDEGRFSTAGRVLSERGVAARLGSAAATAVPQGQESIAGAPRKNDGEEGRSLAADKAGPRVPSSPSPDRSAGQTLLADKAQAGVPSAATRPGHARRGMAEIAAVQPTVAKSLFDSYRLPGDDRAIGDVTWKELQGLARKHAEAYRLLSLIDGYGVPSNQDSPVRDVIKEDTLREFIEIARLSNVH